MPYQLAVQMPRHTPGRETSSLVVPPRSITERRRNSNSERKKSHKTPPLCRSLAIGACSCWGRRGGPGPSPRPCGPDGQQLGQGQPRTRGSGRRSQAKLWRKVVVETSKCFAPSRLFFARSWSRACAAGQVWKGLERQDESRRGRHRKSPVPVPCFLHSTLVTILFLQERI